MSDDPTKSPKRPHSELGETYRMLGIGIELGIAIVGMTLIGWFIDHRYKTGPWGAAIGSFMGIIGGCYNAIKEVAGHEKKRKSK